MNPPSETDRCIRVSAYLSDEGFGYDHWIARQFSGTRGNRSHYGALVLFDTKADRNAFVAAQNAETAR